MASQAPNQTLAARASAVLTTGEVAATRMDVNEACNGVINVQIVFTLGMLTNCTFRYMVSMDGTTYYPIKSLGAGVASVVPTADSTYVETFNAAGYKWFRVSAQGSGTVTSSLAAIDYRWHKRGSQ